MKKSYTTAHKRWNSVIRRPSAKKGYEDVTIDSRWLDFENFQKWFDENSVEGYDLDKDFLTEGNRHYGPDTCVFIPRWLNSAVKVRQSGRFLPGVNASKLRFMAFINNKYAGMFVTELEAHQAWQKAKVQSLNDYQVRYLKEPVFDTRVYARLQSLIETVEEDLVNGRPTTIFSKQSPAHT